MKNNLETWYNKLHEAYQGLVKEWDKWTDKPSEGFEALRSHIDRIEAAEYMTRNVAIFSAAMDQIGAKCYGTVWRKTTIVSSGIHIMYEFVVDHNELIEVVRTDNNGDTERFEERITGTIQLLGFLHNVDPRLC